MISKPDEFQSVALAVIQAQLRLRSLAVSGYLHMTPVAKWLGHFSGLP
jgi:hypothetical protein